MLFCSDDFLRIPAGGCNNEDVPAYVFCIELFINRLNRVQQAVGFYYMAYIIILILIDAYLSRIPTVWLHFSKSAKLEYSFSRYS